MVVQDERVKKTIVVKYGGSAMGASFEQVLEDVAHLHQLGVQIVLVHGGGKEISMMLDRLGIESKFVDGLRVTDEDTMRVVEMVLGGVINKRIVASLQSQGVQSVGMTGVDGGLLEVVPKQQTNLGYVGDIVQVNASVIEAAFNAGWLPVIAPIGLDAQGVRYNINADEAAGAIAGAVGAQALYMLTDVPGIMTVVGGQKEVMNQVTPAMIEVMIQNGGIHGGMIPKVAACMQALGAGAAEVHILNGTSLHILIERVMGMETVGTTVLSDEKCKKLA